MALFASLVKLFTSREVNKKADKAGKPVSNVKLYSSGMNDIYSDNADILKGVQFCATMKLRTHLNVLEHHGETFEGPVSKAPKYGTEADGIWIPKVKTWKELGINLDEIPPSTMASEIGQIPEDGGEYLQFLKDFRRIVESNDSIEDKINHINKLPKQKPAYSSYMGDPAFAEKWFGRHISCVPGISNKIMAMLKAAGINNIYDLRQSTDDDLLQIKGIGPAVLTKIRQYLKSI